MGARTAQIRQFLLKFDQFREVPQDLTEPTVIGSVISVIAMVLVVFLLVFETASYFDNSPITSVVVDSNQDQMLQINFDISFWDLACQHIQVGVWDSFGSERLNITKRIKRYDIVDPSLPTPTRPPLVGDDEDKDEIHGSVVDAPDGSGTKHMHLYTEDEILELDHEHLSDELQIEYDRDWDSNSDFSQLERSPDDFENVIQSHDFIFVNFFAEWCSHCREFAPSWAEFAEKVNSGVVPLYDGDGNQLTNRNFRVLKINCVDFEDTCLTERVRGFPSVRLYRRRSAMHRDTRNFIEFWGDRTVEELLKFSVEELKNFHHAKDVHFHHIFEKGCRLKGSTAVSRVPGTLHFEAAHSRDLSLNYVFTNVSHTINHLSFSSEDDVNWEAQISMPTSYKSKAARLDGKSFITQAFHESPHHYMQVVSTLFTDLYRRTYQLTHQHRMSKAGTATAPQAKFSYQLSPVEVHVQFGRKRWYEFITTLMAIVGGAFSSMALLQLFISTSLKTVYKDNMGKLG